MKKNKFTMIITEFLPLVDEEMYIKIEEIDDGSLALINKENETIEQFGKEVKTKVLKLLKKIDISEPPNFVFGCDGVFCSIMVGSGYNSYTFHWWDSVPLNKNWRPLRKIKKIFMPETAT
jgi:hypothetical protein